MPINSFEHATLKAICDVLAETSTGFTGRELHEFLRASNINQNDLNPSNKRQLLLGSLSQQQAQDKCANNIVKFIQTAMHPNNFRGDLIRFENYREQLNMALAFEGYAIDERGNLISSKVVHSLNEAQQRALRIRGELERRQAHPEVRKYCKKEILEKNFFHAVFEAAKGFAERVREKSGLNLDGVRLFKTALGFTYDEKTKRITQYPLLATTPLETVTERSQQVGILKIAEGIFSAYRNEIAHEPRLLSQLSEEDAIDILTTLSMLHRWLDKAVPTNIYLTK